MKGILWQISRKLEVEKMHAVMLRNLNGCLKGFLLKVIEVCGLGQGSLWCLLSILR
jgi:hypothetical protein